MRYRKGDIPRISALKRIALTATVIVVLVVIRRNYVVGAGIGRDVSVDICRIGGNVGLRNIVTLLRRGLSGTLLRRRILGSGIFITVCRHSLGHTFLFEALQLRASRAQLLVESAVIRAFICVPRHKAAAGIYRLHIGIQLRCKQRRFGHIKTFCRLSKDFRAVSEQVVYSLNRTNCRGKRKQRRNKKCNEL